MDVDFEIGDAVRKLAAAGLLEADGDRFRAVPIDRAQDRLDHLWERYARAGGEAITVAG